MMFTNHDRHAKTTAHETALACLEAGITAALPERIVEATVERDGDTLRVLDDAYDLSAFDEVVVLGGGKAASGLAAALETILGDRIGEGLIVTTDVDPDRLHSAIDVREGDHPTPSERNVAATADLLDMAANADEGTLVIAVVTGGASALLCAPADGSGSSVTGLSLDALRATTDALLESGASIDEVNAVRKHCSAIKGGRLARAVAPATVLTLAISDVVGDDPAVIGSGPTIPDPTTFDDAMDVIDRYGIEQEITPAVLDYLEAGVNGVIDETPTESDVAADDSAYHVLANGRTAIDAAVRTATERGYEPLVLSSRLRGEAREIGRVHAAIAEEIREVGDPVEAPAILCSGGEVTVTVQGEGSGGPNQELALAAGLELAETGTDAVLASVDTDGVDGPTDAAGAIADRETVADEPAEAREALANNDAGSVLDERHVVLRTGYTGTNVNDLRVLVIEDVDRK